SSPPYFVTAFQHSVDSVHVFNYYPEPIEITGLILASEEEQTLPDPIELDGFANNHADAALFSTSQEHVSALLFRVKGTDDRQVGELLPWPSPNTYAVKRPAVHIPASHFEVKDEQVVLLPGDHIIDTSVVIPPGYTLLIDAGQNIDMVNGAFILSYSQVELSGTEEVPIQFKSSDGTGLGLTVLQADGPSLIEHVIYSDMDAYRFGPWNLSGSLNLYESDVTINNLHIQNNRCEDALNIIRSHFEMSDCSFQEIYADAFDSDFSTGSLRTTIFHDIGNDAIDFSGSQVDIRSCEMSQVGDKGVSGGEDSQLTVRDCVIQDANIGIASKDNSVLMTSDCTLESCNYGMVVFQKKPEYGPAHIDAQGLSWKRIDTPFLIEEGSSVKLEKKLVLGKEKKVAERFY
ncbi:MAG: right-handed parallel beta-helix repeat-containing protein, partial [Flavobacteriales bacterium]|nr:right-handed parallel beta-helix repeat-containing protein [Flavobacteriales bacterium]